MRPLGRIFGGVTRFARHPPPPATEDNVSALFSPFYATKKHRKAEALRCDIERSNARLEALADSEEVLCLQGSTTDQTTVNILLSEDLRSV